MCSGIHFTGEVSELSRDKLELGDSGKIVRPLSHLGDFFNTVTFSEIQRDKPSLSVFKELPD